MIHNCKDDHSLEYFQKEDAFAEQALKEYKQTVLTFSEQFREIMNELGRNSGELSKYLQEDQCTKDIANKMLHYSYRMDALSAFIESIIGLYPIAKTLIETRDLALEELKLISKQLENKKGK